MMRTRMKTRFVAVAVAVAAVAVAGCSNDTGSAAGTSTDAAFITDMTTHHEGAIEMAELAKTRATHPEVRALANDIISAQRAEISVMGRVRDDMHGMGMQNGGHMGMSQHEMGMDMDMSTLRRARPFDRAFLDMMVPHHHGAIRIARVELAKGKQGGLRDIALKIIGAQSREIRQMRDWRKRWYGSGGAAMHGSGQGSMSGHRSAMGRSG
jgi:uncharacterized protein (DUF305 family)